MLYWLQRSEAIRLKEEYHAFRDRCGLLLFVFSSALLIADQLRPDEENFSFTPPYMVCVQVFLCWLLYVYTGLALRENVLKVGGQPHLSLMRAKLVSTTAFLNCTVHFPEDLRQSCT